MRLTKLSPNWAHQMGLSHCPKMLLSGNHSATAHLVIDNLLIFRTLGLYSGGDLAPSLGDGKFFRGPRFLNYVFPEKMSIFTPKISDDLFLVIDQVFQILRFFTVLNVVYDPFFTRETTISEKNSLIRPVFYSVRTFARIRQHYFSKYWGDQCMGRPPPQILGGPSLSPPRSPPLGDAYRLCCYSAS